MALARRRSTPDVVPLDANTTAVRACPTGLPLFPPCVVGRGMYGGVGPGSSGVLPCRPPLALSFLVSHFAERW